MWFTQASSAANGGDRTFLPGATDVTTRGVVYGPRSGQKLAVSVDVSPR
jgi:hypothetical protein